MNIGNLNRTARVALGLILISLVFIGPKTMWGWIGVVSLLTAAFRFCPVYWLAGINTCRLLQR